MLNWLKAKNAPMSFTSLIEGLKNSLTYFFGSSNKENNEFEVFTNELVEEILKTDDSVLGQKRHISKPNYCRNFGYLSNETKIKKLEKALLSYRTKSFHKERRQALKDGKHKFMSKHFPKNYKSPMKFVCFVKDLRERQTTQISKLPETDFPKKVFSAEGIVNINELLLELSTKLPNLEEEELLRKLYEVQFDTAKLF